MKKMKKEIIKKNKDYNHEGTTASWFLQEKECLVLEEMYWYMVDNGYIQNDICVLCNDGIMIQDKYYKPTLLDELQVHIQQTTGFVLKLEEKPLSEGYENIIDKHIIFDLWNRDGNDGMYADYFKVLYSEEYVFVMNVYIIIIKFIGKKMSERIGKKYPVKLMVISRIIY
jgi:hypothetical protein